MIRVRVAGDLAALTFDAPERLNAVDAPMLAELTAALERLDADPGVRVITLTGAGRGFCAGASLAVPADGPLVIDTATLYAAGRVVAAMTATRTPILALVNGVAAGVGVSFALAADYVLASEAASFMLAFTKIGLMPDGGATALVAASIGRARAMRLALTAEHLPAATAAQWGLIAEVVPTAEFAARSAVLARELAASAPLATGATKTAINAASLDLAAAIGREETGQEALLHTADFREGVGAFNGKRAARFHGA